MELSEPGSTLNKVGWVRWEIVTLLLYGSASCAIPSLFEMLAWAP